MQHSKVIDVNDKSLKLQAIDGREFFVVRSLIVCYTYYPNLNATQLDVLHWYENKLNVNASDLLIEGKWNASQLHHQSSLDF